VKRGIGFVGLKPVISTGVALGVALIDLLLVVGAAAALGVLLTGGWEWETRFGLVRAYTASNLLYGLALAGVLRLTVLGRFNRFLGVVDLGVLGARLEGRLSALASAASQLDGRTAGRIAAAVILASSIAKALNAHYYYGFCCGDDVEIQEMSLGYLFGEHWPIWDIRSAVYPVGFIYPAQAAAYGMGFVEPRQLVFAGRLVVVGFSAACLYLSYRLAVRCAGVHAAGLCAVAILAVSKVFSTFGSSELPGAVAATFLVGSCLLLLKATPGRVVIAAACLGLAASLRFSEVFFVAAAVLALGASRRWLSAVALGILSTACFLAILGTADYLYRGEPFTALVRIVDFTLVKQLSSRGFQPFHYYLSSAWSWADWVLLVFVAFGVTRAPLTIAIWFIVPVVCLSALPHKEARYLVPVMPFVSVLGGLGAWSVFSQDAAARRPGRSVSRRLAVAAAFVLALLLEVDGFRFRRSEAAVDAVRLVADRGAAKVVALERSWMAGGHLYLRGARSLLEIEESHLVNASALQRFLTTSGADYVGLQRDTLAARGYDALLLRLGFTELDPLSPPRAYRVFARRRPAFGG